MPYQPQGAPVRLPCPSTSKQDDSRRRENLNILRFGLVEVQRAKQTIQSDGIFILPELCDSALRSVFPMVVSDVCRAAALSVTSANILAGPPKEPL